MTEQEFRQKRKAVGYSDKSIDEEVADIRDFYNSMDKLYKEKGLKNPQTFEDYLNMAPVIDDVYGAL